MHDVIIVVERRCPLSHDSFLSDLVTVFIDKFLPIPTYAVIFPLDGWLGKFVWLTASAELTLEKLDTKDSEYEQEQEYDKQYIEKCWNRFKQGVYNSLNTLILRYHSKRSKCSQGPETSDEGHVCTIHDSLKYPSDDREHDDDEIENVPRISKIGLLTEVETLSNNFDHAFDDEDDRNDQQHESDGFFLVSIGKLWFI